MATTAESIRDGLRWVGGLVKIGVKRALIIGILAALFAGAVVITTRERSSDCSGITDEQRSLLDSLREPDPSRSFLALREPACSDGVFAVRLDGLADEMEAATDQLADDGWGLETNFLPFFQELWRRCFASDDPAWAAIEISIDASRSGTVREARAIAPEGLDACEAERRDRSPFYP